MNSSPEIPLRFVPSRVEGVAGVVEVLVFPDRLELIRPADSKIFRFVQMAKWPRGLPAAVRRWLYRFGFKPSWLPVGERDWFRAPPDRFFRFYTDPPLVIYMPDEGDLPYGQTCFLRLQQVLLLAGFSTFDLG